MSVKLIQQVTMNVRDALESYKEDGYEKVVFTSDEELHSATYKIDEVLDTMDETLGTESIQSIIELKLLSIVCVHLGSDNVSKS